MRYVVRPLTVEARNRMTGKGTEHSPFRSTWTATEDLLERELRMLRARDVVMQIDCAESDIRLDGRMRATARPLSPQSALAFNTPKDPMLFCCGRYRTWNDNIRAIALGLEALRKLDRYGIVQTDEQYRGWKAIGATSTPDWVDVLAAYSGWPHHEVRNDPDGAYHAALFKAHPDHGGTREAVEEVRQAKSRYTSSSWRGDT